MITKEDVLRVMQGSTRITHWSIELGSEHGTGWGYAYDTVTLSDGRKLVKNVWFVYDELLRPDSFAEICVRGAKRAWDDIGKAR